jgi:hypothetical protein
MRSIYRIALLTPLAYALLSPVSMDYQAPHAQKSAEEKRFEQELERFPYTLQSLLQYR